MLQKNKFTKPVKKFPQGMIKYNSVAKDEDDHNYINYYCSFLTNFAGIAYVSFYNLKLQFKDGRLKYEMTDFIVSFTRSKSNTGAVFYTNSVSIENSNPLENFYASSAKYSDKENFGFH